MALPVVSKTYFDSIKAITDQFDKYRPDVVYKPDVSLSTLKAANLIYEKAIDERNAAAAVLDEKIIALNIAQANVSKQESSFLVQTGEQFTKDSNEYVWAGGTRQSDANEKRKATLEETQRLAKLQAAEEAAKVEAEKAQLAAEMVALKAEVERLRAEKGKNV